MLVDHREILRQDYVLNIIANGTKPEQLDTGVYKIAHFGSSEWPRGLEHYPEQLSVGSYGVCDSKDNLLEKCPELVTSERRFVVTLTPIVRAEQSPTGGWRWHKWGEYIGAYTPKHEYIYDEDIDLVYVYQIYEDVSC